MKLLVRFLFIINIVINSREKGTRQLNATFSFNFIEIINKDSIGRRKWSENGSIERQEKHRTQHYGTVYPRYGTALIFVATV